MPIRTISTSGTVVNHGNVRTTFRLHLRGVIVGLGLVTAETDLALDPGEAAPRTLTVDAPLELGQVLQSYVQLDRLAPQPLAAVDRRDRTPYEETIARVQMEATRDMQIVNGSAFRAYAIQLFTLIAAGSGAVLHSQERRSGLIDPGYMAFTGFSPFDLPAVDVAGGVRLAVEITPVRVDRVGIDYVDTPLPSQRTTWTSPVFGAGDHWIQPTRAGSVFRLGGVHNSIRLTVS